ncbi:MAG: PIN domain-containing protein [Pseudonocardia sp.]|nr:PIN domain-containing protein [Pseudonocardia sp.]
MSRALLDVNVLLSLLDTDHVDHQRARDWLGSEISAGWASCPITQNGFVRVVSQPRYPSPVSPSVAAEILEQACATDHHEFWPCDLSVLDTHSIDRTKIHGPRQVTDTYLLALAVKNNGTLVTFDRSIVSSSVPTASAGNLTVL